MFQMNKTLNHLINNQKKKKSKSKNKSTILDKFITQNEKHPTRLTLFSDYQNLIRTSNSKNKNKNNSKCSFSQKNKSFSKEKSPNKKHNNIELKHTKNVKMENSIGNLTELDAKNILATCDGKDYCMIMQVDDKTLEVRS